MVKERTPGSERRLHVRVHPAPDYDVTVHFSDNGFVWVSVQVVDLSVGGLGLLVSDDLAVKRVGDRVQLRLGLPTGNVVDLAATIRHVGQREYGVCGVQFDQTDDEALTQVRAAVAELLERGNVA